MKYVFQIFTGDLSEKSLADPQEIIRKLTKAHKAGKLAGVLCGWTKDKAFYQALGKQLHKWGVPMYLKIAVFSELSGYKEFESMIDYYGKPMKPYVLNPEESFEFRCPLSQHNRSVLNEIYNESFSDLPFDGIFLDRIRYSSFLSGVAGIGGCFCPECVKRYEAAGIPVDELRQRLIQLEAEKDLRLFAYENGRWSLEDPLLQAFFDVKCQIISEALKEYADYFHGRGMMIGFDLFAPAFGYFCGQNAQELRQFADFVKPMMYRHTDGPAGLPCERERMILAVGEQVGGQMDQLVGDSSEHFKGFVTQELNWLKLQEGCEVWPGIEANYIEPIALIHPGELLENLQLLTSLGYDTMVASWNLNKIPEENLNTLLEF